MNQNFFVPLSRVRFQHMLDNIRFPVVVVVVVAAVVVMELDIKIGNSEVR